MLSTLLARLKPDSSPVWPQMRGTVTADTLVAGPFNFTRASASMRILPTGAEASSFTGLLGGTVRGKASLQIGDKPSYKLDATFIQVNPAELGQLAEAKWTGGSMSGKAKLELTGYTDEDLTQSAKGTIHFDWHRGAITDSGIPAVLSKFDDWTGDAAVARWQRIPGRYARAEGNPENRGAGQGKTWDACQGEFPDCRGAAEGQCVFTGKMKTWRFLLPLSPFPARQFFSTWMESSSRPSAPWSAVGRSGAKCAGSIQSTPSA